MNEKSIIGAVRWDAWVGNKGAVGINVAQNLSLEKYYYRLPFFAKIIDEKTVEIDGSTQEILDKEIEYAKNAGIDYWAICWYPDGSNLEHQRHLYMSSLHKNDVKWCIILGTNPFDLKNDLPWLVEQFREDNYQKVLNGRPLIYYFEFNENQREVINKIRELTEIAGLPTPYIVAMGFTPDVSIPAKILGADSISAYCCTAPTGSTYEEQAKVESARWDEYKNTGMKVIPFVTVGWDNRPRFDDGHEMIWPHDGYLESWIEQGTPEEISAHLQQAINWNKINTDVAEANAVLIYAWNENDEGGWIVPTLYELRDAGRPLRLDAISKVSK